MKKFRFTLVVCMLISMLLLGCSTSIKTEPELIETQATTEAAVPAETQTEAPAESTTEGTVTEEEIVNDVTEDAEEDIVYEEGTSDYYIHVVYKDQIARYAAALSEQWDEGKYFENDLSALPYYYYEGNALNNVGFGFVDLDNDGNWELVIGAILNADKDPAVFEIWTLVDGEPVMIAQGGSRNRYVLQYVEEDGMWYVVNEASSSAFNSATYYLMLSEGKFEVVQGVVLDAAADEQNPWFLTYDLDWDVSNDEPIGEETARAILESNRMHYTALEYFPYIYFCS